MRVQFMREASAAAVYMVDDAMTVAVHVEHHIVGRVSALKQQGVEILDPPPGSNTESLFDSTDSANPVDTGAKVWVVEDGLLVDLLSPLD